VLLSPHPINEFSSTEATMDLGIKGRRAIVTGGSRGIGYQTAKRFLEEGTRVLICARGAEELDESREELAEETGGEVTALQADTSQEGSAEKIVDSALEAFGGVDVLVNNAGEMSSGRFEVMTDEGLQTQLNTKLFGFLRLIRAVVPHMKKKMGPHRQFDRRSRKRAGPLHVQ
jgi:3-oxoacyl-[acyl-carrier protein] reductase